MRKWLLINLFFPIIVFAQLTDDFGDGNFNNNPTWLGDTANFVVNTANQLQLNAPAVADTAYLYTANTLLDSTEWRFYLQLGFAPSINNLVKIYLAADQYGLKDTLNGYFIRIGENDSNDAVELYKQTGNVESLIIRGTNGIAADNFNIRIKITRDNMGNWNLYVDTLGGTNFQLEGSGFDTTHSTTNYIGVFCKYTSTRSDKFFFDDFYAGPFIVDTIPPKIIALSVISQNQLAVQFDEGVEQLSAENTANYFANNGIGNPDIAVRDASNQSLVHLTFLNDFPNNLINTLTLSGVQDFDSNVVHNDTAAFIFITINQNDIVINEVLFNPNPYGVDFVEIYNRSGRTIDIKDLRLSNAFDDGTLDDIEIVADSSYSFFSGRYLVLTTDPDDIKQSYYTSNPADFITMSAMPSFPDHKGTIVLLDSASNKIDAFHYNDDMHFALIDDEEGISLERIDFNKPTQDENNWHSAAATVGYATPAYKNSQYDDASPGTDIITVEPEVFSPDNDGYHDFVSIHYAMDAAGYVADVMIYDANGRFVKHLVNNELLGTKGTFTWDGINENGEKARIGIYIIYFETFDLQGKVIKLKQTCVLGGELR